MGHIGRLLGSFAVLVWVAGCTSTPLPVATAPEPEPAKALTPIKLERADIRAIEDGVRRSLKDPESARFGEMLAGQEAGKDITVCLLVNAKNSYGGYTGMKPMMGLLFREKAGPKFVVVPDDGRLPQHRDTAIYTVCRNYGLALSG